MGILEERVPCRKIVSSAVIGWFSFRTLPEESTSLLEVRRLARSALLEVKPYPRTEKIC
jgi:hypothetical protein